MKTTSESALDDLGDLRDTWRGQLLARCDAVLREHQRTVALPENIPVPKPDLGAIAERVRKENTTDKEEGTFRKKTVSTLSDDYPQKLRDHLNETILKVAVEERDRFKKDLDSTVSHFNQELSAVLGQKTQEYREMSQRQQTAQQYTDTAAVHAAAAKAASTLLDAARQQRLKIAAT